MKILSISFKDIQVILKDRGAIIWLFVLPLVFIIIFTSLFTASQAGSEKDNRIPLPVLNLDTDGEASQDLISRLQSAGGVDTSLIDQTQANEGIASKKITDLLVIPNGFSKTIEGSQPASLELDSADASSTNTQSLLLILNGVTRDMALETQLIASLKQMGEMQASAPSEFQVFTSDRLVNQARTQFTQSRTTPLVVINEKLPSSLQKREADLNPIQLSVPGFTILFAFLAAQATAKAIYDEKKIGSFRRLLAAPLSKFAILTGKLLPNFIIVLIQIVVIFSVSAILLPLMGMNRLTFGNDPLALVVASLVIAFCSTSLGIVIAAVAHTEGQIGGISSMILWVMGFLGGAIIPISLFNNAVFNTVGSFVPQSWAVKTFQDILVRGYTLTQILPSLGILLVFSVVFFAFGLWRFDFD